MNSRWFIVLGCLLCSVQLIYPIIVDSASDNRYIPQLPRVLLSFDNRESGFATDFFVVTGKRAIGSNEEEIPLGELYGEFDLGKIARAITVLGKPNPLAVINPAWQDASFIWTVNQKLQGYGVSFFYHQRLHDWFSIGGSWLFMRVQTHQSFFFKSTNAVLTPPGDTDLKVLDAARRAINVELGLPFNKITESGFGDIDLYCRLGKREAYSYRFRTVDAGVRIGALIPTAAIADLKSPASVPFGGEKHPGVYGALDAELELKEDWKVGMYAKLSKRFAKTCVHRVPTNNEQPLWGVLVIPTRMNPGITFLFSPYISFENLREGFGVRIRYTLTHHQEDNWWDARTDQTIPANFTPLKKLSEWSSDCISLSAFYDFEKMKENRRLAPIVTLTWDIPTSLVVAKRMPKTNKVSLGIEFNF